MQGFGFEAGDCCGDVEEGCFEVGEESLEGRHCCGGVVEWVRRGAWV